METKHRELLRRNRVKLGKDLVVKEDFLNFLHQEKILSETMKEEIEVQMTSSKKNSKVLDLLPKRGPKAFKAFIYALMNTDQEHIAEMLDGTLAEQYKKEYNPDEYYKCEPSGDGISASSEAQGRRQNLFGQPTEEEEDKPLDMTKGGLLDVRVKPVSEIDDSSKKVFYAPPPSVYKMNSNPRGRALIINNKEFPNRRSGEVFRDGTDYDATNMTELLEKLGYKVRVETNLDSKNLHDVLSAESQEKEHFNLDSFVCVILSHGGKNVVFGVDDVQVTVDDIVSYFDSSNCPYLCQKPKLFILQACQGTDYDRGTHIVEATDAGPGPESESVKAVTKEIDKLNISSRQPNAPLPTDNVKVPSKGDTLVAYAAYEGFRSWRNAEFGSWFIRAIVDVFMENSHHMHVDDLLKKVRRVISKSQTLNERHYKQVTAEYGSLLKNMYFFPGLSFDENDQNNVASGK